MSGLGHRVDLRHGLSMPALGLGTYTTSGKACENAVFTAIRAGYRLIDTASMYGNEQQVGAAIARATSQLSVPREELFVVSKLYPTQGYEATLRAFDATMQQLGVKYVDLYLIHWPGGGAAKRKGSWKAMEEVLASGRCRAIGVSNYMEAHIQEIVDDPGLHVVPHVNQCELHPQLQWRELRAYCATHGVQFMGYMPFGGEGAPLLRDPKVRAAATVASAAAGRAVTPAQLLVHFVRAQGAVAIPRSRDAGRQLSNAEVGAEGGGGGLLDVGSEAVAMLEGMDVAEHYDWDPTSLA